MITIKTTGLLDIASKVGANITQFAKIAEVAIYHTMATKGVALAVQQVGKIQPRPPVDRGQYRQSFKAYPIPGGAVLSNTAAYAGVIEYGRRPGQKMPPVDVIMRWVIRKGILGRARMKKMAPQDLEKEARQVAFAIARKIGRDGWRHDNPMLVLEKVGVKLIQSMPNDILRYYNALQKKGH